MNETIIQKHFGLVIKETRESKRISQEKFAEIVGLHRTYISDVERGLRNISLINIFKIAHALDVKPSDIFHRMEASIKSFNQNP
jgi:transcriptional regulator with XRE-family HTH domain